MTESEYIFHWSLTIGAGFLLALCALVIRFFRIRSERKHPQ